MEIMTSVSGRVVGRNNTEWNYFHNKCKWLSGCGIITQNGNNDKGNGRVVAA